MEACLLRSIRRQNVAMELYKFTNSSRSLYLLRYGTLRILLLLLSFDTNRFLEGSTTASINTQVTRADDSVDSLVSSYLVLALRFAAIIRPKHLVSLVCFSLVPVAIHIDHLMQ
jgi:hypothetical protein